MSAEVAGFRDQQPEVARQVPVLYVPGPFPLTTSPLDFTTSARLMHVAYEKSRAFLAEAHPSGPGLYGDAPLITLTGASGRCDAGVWEALDEGARAIRLTRG